MADTEEEYNKFLREQADAYTAGLKKIFQTAMDYHGRKCDSPYPLNIICTRAFVEHFMEDFASELARRQKEAVPEMERRRKRIQKTEDDVLTHFFGPPFDPRNN